jgi:hypothetical protein
MPSTRTFTAARDGAKEARLELVHGGTHVTIRPAELDELCRAEFEGVTPKVSSEGGSVAIRYPRFSLAELTRHPAHRAEIEVSTALPWSLVFDGGLGKSSVDLRGTELRAFEIAGGAGDVQIVLPPPKGVVRIGIRGGASKLTVLHPEAAAVGLRIAGGASRIAFDGRRYGAIGGSTRLETPGAGDAADRYEIEIGGGASELTVAGSE